MDVPEQDRQLFYQHMGHSKEINATIYQAPLAHQEVSRVGMHLLQIDQCKGLLSFQVCTGWPNKNRIPYYIFAATTDIIMLFLLKCSEVTTENNKRQFFKRVLNILSKLVKIWYLVNVSANRL